jgi:hypothetical protein
LLGPDKSANRTSLTVSAVSRFFEQHFSVHSAE